VSRGQRRGGCPSLLTPRPPPPSSEAVRGGGALPPVTSKIRASERGGVPRTPPTVPCAFGVVCHAHTRSGTSHACACVPAFPCPVGMRRRGGGSAATVSTRPAVVRYVPASFPLVTRGAFTRCSCPRSPPVPTARRSIHHHSARRVLLRRLPRRPSRGLAGVACSHRAAKVSP